VNGLGDLLDPKGLLGKGRLSVPREWLGTLQCVVVTGMSGAGKSIALHSLEDFGFFCVDNLPLQLLIPLMALYHRWGYHLSKIAVGADIRTGVPLSELLPSLRALRKQGFPFGVVFFDADNGTLIRRFSETRRRHPLGTSVIAGIRKERKHLQSVKSFADHIVDTSNMTPTEMKEVLLKTLEIRHPRGTAVAVTSFGYRYGIPQDADMVFDVRFLPNPNYVPSLHHLTGKNQNVASYIFRTVEARTFMRHAMEMMDFLIPCYVREGKSYLTVAVGCTGGRHRSVAVAESLAKALKGRSKSLDVRVIHRDMEKGN